MEHAKRHIFLYRLLRPLISPFFKAIFRYQCDTLADMGRPALVLSNHVTDVDPPLVALACPKQMYFVASEHAFRWGLASKLLRFVAGPIVRLKGSTGVGTTKDILRALRAGHNVCIFPEGNRTYTGQTGPFVAATGKLAKASGADLVTFRLEGGYFTWPRWAKTRRRGEMRGRVANHYTSERLAEMSVDEVNEAIAKDLYVDAYADQRARPVAYRGKRLAEWLELALYLCPGCGQFGTLHSQDDTLFCDCGLNGRYTEYGALEGFPHKTVTYWDAWQWEQLGKIAADAGEEDLFSDENQGLYVIDPCVSSTLVEEGVLRMGKGTLSIGTRTFPLAQLPDIAISGKMTLTFSHEGTPYEIQSRHPRSAVKYLHLHKIIKGARE